jgi:hypothetical protein
MDPKKTLSEISHLFLSEMRERQGGNSAAPNRPARIPPGKTRESAAQPNHAAPQAAPRQPAQDESEMSPAEFVRNLATDPAVAQSDNRPIPSSSSTAACVSVVLGSHLTDHPAEKIRQYARHLAAQCGRLGLIEADSAEFGITCLELQGGDGEAPIVIDELDGRRMSETLAELSFDVDRWIVCLPNPRTSEAREVLRLAPHWVLLTTSDHEGVVATYRALKGLADLGKRQGAGFTPRLSLVVLDARDEAHATAVFRKLDAVSRQFLGCPMESELPVRPVRDVAEHVLLHCRATHDKAQLATAPQWQIVANFLSAAIAPQPIAQDAMQDQTVQFNSNHESTASETNMQTAENMHAMPGMQHLSGETANDQSSTSRANRPTSPRLAPMDDESYEEVLELADDTSPKSILDAVVRQGGAAGAWVQCPLKAPSCPQAILAVGRDQRLVLLAIAGRGLTELRSIGLALRWMEENRELIRMALPQLAIDPQAAPEIRLLVDHADLTAELLQPLLESGTIRVQAYRRVKWGRKAGLLLEAA